MLNQVKEENGNLICLKHNEKIIMFAMDNQVPFNDALICSECIQERPTISKQIIGIAQVRKLINEKYTNKEFESENLALLENLQQFSINVIEYKNRVISLADMILGILTQWIIDLKCKINNEQTTLIQELYQFHQNSFQVKQDDQQIKKINNAHLTKLLSLMKQLQNQNELMICNQQFNVIENTILIHKIKDEEIQIMDFDELQQEDPQNLVKMPSKIIQVNVIKQSETCFAIAFNKQGTLMISGCNEKIKVWKLQRDKLIEDKILTRHSVNIYCLVFSKKINWFASCSDQTIIGWQQEGNDWINTEPAILHQDAICCLLLNSKENELISGSCDKTIICWKVNYKTNKIEYNYTLDKHTNTICCISLNPSETSLVSCSYDKTIILWSKGTNEKWEYTNHIQVKFGRRICFINDTQIFFQPNSLNQTILFLIENNTLVEQTNLNILLKKGKDDMFLFPTIYNKRRQIIIQKHNKYVYVIKRSSNGRFGIILEPIDCQHYWNYGALTEDGEYLVIWNDKTKEFRVHQIIY